MLRCMGPNLAQTDRAWLLRLPGRQSWGQLTLRDLSAGPNLMRWTAPHEASRCR